MKKVLYPFILVISILFLSCGGKTESESQETTNTDEFGNMDEFVMDEFGLSLKLMIPNEDMARGKPRVSYNDAQGNYSLIVGPKYSVLIYDDMESDVAGTKEYVENHNLYKEYEYIKEEPGLLIYSQTLPDDSRTFYHFYLYREIGGVNYVIKDDDQIDYTKLSIEKILKSLNTLEASSAS